MIEREANRVLTNATLAVYADDLDPDKVSARLALEPTRSFRRGEAIIGRRRRYGDHPIGGWLLSSRDHLVSDDLQAHLAWLLQRITPAAEGISVLVSEGFDVAIICVISGTELGGGPTIPSQALRDLARLGIPVDFDVYC